MGLFSWLMGKSSAPASAPAQMPTSAATTAPPVQVSLLPTPKAPGLLTRAGRAVWQHYQTQQAAKQQAVQNAPAAAPDHFEAIRSEIERFDEERKNLLERGLHGLFMVYAYVAPFLVALAIGQEIADQYSGPYLWGNSWSVATHLVAWAGELGLAALTLSIATAIRRYAADKDYLYRLLASCFFFVVFSLASGLAQWYVATGHIHPTPGAGLASLLFRVSMVPAIDLSSMLYLSIMKLKSLKRYLAEQAQKAEAIEQVNKSHLRIEEAQEEAEQARQRHDQYMQSLNATQGLVIRLQEIITEKIVTEASRSLPGGEVQQLLPFPSVGASNGNSH